MAMNNCNHYINYSAIIISYTYDVHMISWTYASCILIDHWPVLCTYIHTSEGWCRTVPFSFPVRAHLCFDLSCEARGLGLGLGLGLAAVSVEKLLDHLQCKSLLFVHVLVPVLVIELGRPWRVNWFTTTIGDLIATIFLVIGSVAKIDSHDPVWIIAVRPLTCPLLPNSDVVILCVKAQAG